LLSPCAVKPAVAGAPVEGEIVKAKTCMTPTLADREPAGEELVVEQGDMLRVTQRVRPYGLGIATPRPHANVLIVGSIA
jgi:hypothetical protein